jgi:prepilin-type N-terminal cleavage/methylation domain-containing protein
MKNILKNTSKGFTLIELVMVTIILGILAAVAIPRYQQTVDNAEEAAEKTFVDMVWAGCEQEASERITETGLEAWPYNPLTVIGRSRNISVTLFEGVPDEDNEWQFSVDAAGEPAIFHHRRNDEIYYYKYDSLTFELDELPTLYTNEG